MTTKRLGRPEIDDRPTLSEIADLLAEGEASSVRAAAHSLGIEGDSEVRRLQRKWRDHGAQLMQQAHEKLLLRWRYETELMGGLPSGLLGSRHMSQQIAEAIMATALRQ